MQIIRKSFEILYNRLKPVIFTATKKDPEKAHQLFVTFCQTLYKTKTDKLFFDYPKNSESKFEISNAAGFNKNAEIPPSVLYYLGFNRAVIGTVTAEPNAGNPRPRCQRYPESRSLINKMGLPSQGAKIVAQRLLKYKTSPIPLTINFAATPAKTGSQIIEDLLKTVRIMKNIKKADRFELNISCPNISSAGIYQIETLDKILKSVSAQTQDKEIFLKISPDIDKEYANRLFNIASQHKITGFVIANTTKKYLKKYIPQSPGEGGASGKAVYKHSLQVQRIFEDIIKKNGASQKIIACGGIDTVKKAQERLNPITTGIQIYTPFIYEGPKLIRTIKTETKYKTS